MHEDIRRQLEAMAAAVEPLNEVLRPVFDTAGLGYTLISFTRDDPAVVRFVTNVETDELVHVLAATARQVRLEATKPDPEDDKSG